MRHPPSPCLVNELSVVFSIQAHDKHQLFCDIDGGMAFVIVVVVVFIVIVVVVVVVVVVVLIGG